jgi:CHAD domain-containing protein
MRYAEAAAETVAVRTQELFDHRAGVLDTSDIERVHAMRVATRRLRAVLEVYAPCFPGSLLRPALADVKELADALGARRDPDVELLALERFAAAVGPRERAGIERFAERTRSAQLAGNARLAAALGRADADDLRGRLEALVEHVGGQRPRPEGPA